MPHEILIFGDIINDEDRGFFTFFNPDAEFVSPRTIADSLKEAKGEDIEVKINSPGGAADAGIAIGNLLAQYEGKVTANIIGMAASAAGLIASRAEEIVMAENAGFMVHGIQLGLFSRVDVNDLRELTRVADSFNERLAVTFAARTEKLEGEAKRTKDEWVSFFNEGKDEFLTAQQALERGLIDRIGAPSDAKITVSENSAKVLSRLEGTQLMARVETARERNLSKREEALAAKEAELMAIEKNRELMNRLSMAVLT